MDDCPGGLTLLLHTLHHTLYHTLLYTLLHIYTPPAPRVNWQARGETVNHEAKAAFQLFRRETARARLESSESIGHFQNDAN